MEGAHEGADGTIAGGGHEGDEGGEGGAHAPGGLPVLRMVAADGEAHLSGGGRGQRVNGAQRGAVL